MKEEYWKAYLVEFTSKEDGSTFLKFGACNDRNAEDRFKHEPEQYADYDIKVLASISPNKNNINYMKMGKVEQYFLKKYPRNTKYFKKNFSGISETYQPADKAERNHIIKEFYELQKRVYKGEPLIKLD